MNNNLIIIFNINAITMCIIFEEIITKDPFDKITVKFDDIIIINNDNDKW